MWNNITLCVNYTQIKNNNKDKTSKLDVGGVGTRFWALGTFFRTLYLILKSPFIKQVIYHA